MIDISKHLNQLDLLREYMFDKIDFKTIYIEINMEALPIYTAEQMFKLYDATGWMFPTKDELQPKFNFRTFEEYLNSKQEIKEEIYLSCLEEERLDRLTDLDN